MRRKPKRRCLPQTAQEYHLVKKAKQKKTKLSFKDDPALHILLCLEQCRWWVMDLEARVQALERKRSR